MNATDVAIVITALGSLVGAIVAGIALLKRTGVENNDTLHTRIARLEERAERSEQHARDADERAELKMSEMTTRIDERDVHISRQDRALIAFRRYTFELRKILAASGIPAPDEPPELELSDAP